MNEQAETKLSTVRPMIERERRARSAARAEIAALVLSAAATAGDGRGMEVICADVRFKGGGAIDAIRSASRDMAISPDAFSTGRCAVAMLSVMTPLQWYFF